MEENKVKKLEAQIADLKKRWPAHSVPPGMLMQLDELEEELNLAKQAAEKLEKPTSSDQTAKSD